MYILLGIEIEVHTNDWPCSRLYYCAALCASVDWAGWTGLDWNGVDLVMLGYAGLTLGWTDRTG